MSVDQSPLFVVFTNTQNWQYWYQRLYYVKTKNTHQQNVTPVSTEPGTSTIQVQCFPT